MFAQQNLSESELELINLSLLKSYVLRNAGNELRIDSIESKAIKQNFIPTLSLNGMYAYGASKINADIPTFTLPVSGINIFEGETEFDAKGNFFNTNLTAKALLFSGMQVTYGSKASKEKIRAKNYMLTKERSDIIKDVITTIDKISLLKQAEIVLNESEIRLAKEKEKVVKAIQNGLATPYDREKITVAELKIASKKVELYGNKNLLYHKLSMLTGEDIAVLKAFNFGLNPWDLEDNKKTYKNRPELQALDASITAYDYKLKMNKSLFLPKIQAFATVSYFNLFDTSFDAPNGIITDQPIGLDLNHLQGFPTYLLGVGFEWKLFNGLKHSNEVQKTTIEKDIALNKKEDASEKLALYARKVKTDYEVKNHQLLLKEQEKKVSENTLTLAIKSYQEGLISISERLEAETDYQESVLEYFKLIALQREAALELMISTGSLDINNLK